MIKVIYIFCLVSHCFAFWPGMRSYMWLGSSFRFLLWGFLFCFVFSLSSHKNFPSLWIWTIGPTALNLQRWETHFSEPLGLHLPPLGSCLCVFYLLTTQHHAVTIGLRYYHNLKVPCSHQASFSSWHLNYILRGCSLLCEPGKFWKTAVYGELLNLRSVCLMLYFH